MEGWADVASQAKADVRRDSTTPATPPRLGRAQRREQIISAATRAFANRGFTATSLDEVARQAGISRVLVYRHFESKADLYRAVLDRVCNRLLAACGDHGFTDEAVDGLVTVASEDPEGFRLVFQHAAREPDFRQETSELRAVVTATARAELAGRVSDPSWAAWAAQLTPTVAIEGIIAWLDAGCPDPDGAAARIRHAIAAVIRAAQTHTNSST
jgi:AcrR family transcriptional regulator